jgi:hypothetical protein
MRLSPLYLTFLLELCLLGLASFLGLILLLTFWRFYSKGGVLTQNPHPASSTQQAEQASFTREQIPRRASQFSLKINKKIK